MTVPTLKVLASVLQLHGQGAALQSDHQGISALLSKSPDPIGEEVQGAVINEPGEVTLPSSPTQVYFRRGFGRGGGYYGGGFRRGYVGPYGGFRRGFGRGY
jgi:hypothetical protein